MSTHLPTTPLSTNLPLPSVPVEETPLPETPFLLVTDINAVTDPILRTILRAPTPSRAPTPPLDESYRTDVIENFPNARILPAHLKILFSRDSNGEIIIDHTSETDQEEFEADRHEYLNPHAEPQELNPGDSTEFLIAQQEPITPDGEEEEIEYTEDLDDQDMPPSLPWGNAIDYILAPPTDLPDGLIPTPCIPFQADLASPTDLPDDVIPTPFVPFQGDLQNQAKLKKSKSL